ncbi:MAG TPA: putative toxin-antitoxin system toxin component, PIN family [Ottowia sp.]|uniref:putative toxin-antitoxin system toxin component, PIN family n=1 Tax=Ottowia sp. TaxID=1898956 RepID=UPI002CA9C7D6|nr:putative toxin-antitoxin system toxin component, PIN family [Ottowia sp.]HMN21095.1 putative toxin-antitoxin system toxin component, PIN family [Ottowia sp.]
MLCAASIPRRALELARRRDALVTCELALQELEAVLLLPKFERYASWATRRELLDMVRAHARACDVQAEHVEQAAGACRDADDNLFLALALAAEAHPIVTGDADLLAPHTWPGIAFGTAAGYLERDL